MSRRRVVSGRRAGSLAAALLLSIVAIGQAGEPRRFDFARPRMGTVVRTSVYSDDEALANDAVSAAYARATELNAILSDYEPTSELNQLCRDSGPGKPVRVSGPLFDVLTQSETVSRASGGAFDVTVRPLVALWRKARRTKTLPPEDQLAEALTRVDARSVVLDPEKRTVELRKSNTRIDLGGIAKGYVADAMLDVLRSRGLTRAMVDAGGDLALGDAPPGQRGWRVALDGLDDEANKPTLLLELREKAVATSGDLYKFLEIDGVRYSHIVDPKTGLGLTERIAVTVVAEDAATADAYASAVSVLGPERGLVLVRRTKSVEARIHFFSKGRVRTLTTCGFPDPLPTRDETRPR